MTTGPDIDLGGMIGDHQQRIGIAALTGAAYWRKDPQTERCRFRVAEAATVPVRLGGCESGVDPMAWPRALAWQACPKPSATRGLVTMLALDIELPKDGTIGMRVTQKRADGTVLERKADASSVLMPSDFDASQPFSIVLELGPGEYTLEPHVYPRFRK